MAVAELTIFGWHDKETIMRDIILSDPEAKSLFGSIIARFIVSRSLSLVS